MYRLIVKTRIFFAYLLAIILILLIPFFFFNFSGSWMKRVAEKIPLREMTFEKADTTTIP